MPLARVFGRVLSKTRPLPRLARCAATAGLVGAVFAVQQVADPLLPGSFPFLLGILAVLLASALFNGRAGLLAAALCGSGAAYFYLPPAGFAVAAVPHMVALGLFGLVSAATALSIETLHHLVEDLRKAEAHRRLLLREYQHRTKNDLQSLVALLLLRARAAPEGLARAALQEAADHARALARVQNRLQAVAPGAGGEAVIDTRSFVAGMAADLDSGAAGDGLRAVAVIAQAEAHVLPSERALQLGLVLNECVTNALKYGFPDDRPGTIEVRFRLDAEKDDFVLSIRDDGVGMAAADPAGRPGLGTRLLRALASQLRGSFSRGPAAGGGTLCLLRFPADDPSMTRRP